MGLINSKNYSKNNKKYSQVDTQEQKEYDNKDKVERITKRAKVINKMFDDANFY